MRSVAFILGLVGGVWLRGRLDALERLYEQAARERVGGVA